MIIRKAKLTDLPTLAKFGYAILDYHRKLDDFYAPAKNTKKIFLDYFKKCIHSANKLFLVAEENKKIIGYVLAETKNRPPVFKIQKTGFLSDAYIVEKFRHQGIIKLFLEEVFIWFKKKNIKIIELTVHNKNTLGKNAWNKYGFKVYDLKCRLELK